MRNWVDRVLQMEAYVRQDDQEGRNGTHGVLERADVIWAVWSDDGETPVVRVIRGRELDGPDLKHGALQFQNELGVLETAALHGDEIGLRKAMGASDFEILVQFLLEACVLAAVGASFGTFLGTIVCRALSANFPYGLVVNPMGLLIAWVTALVLAIVFGMYPAIRASRLSPMEAMR